MTSPLQRAEWPGTSGPAPAPPPRALGSVRRTTTVDILRPDGLQGALVLAGRGRDLVTRPDGVTEVASEAATRVVVDSDDDRRIVRSLQTDPSEPALAELVGRRASTGFRRTLDEVLAHRRGSALFLLLDEVPMATMISANVVVRSPGGLGADSAPPSGICIGWRADSLLTTHVARTGRVLDLPGPRAPTLVDPADPIGWHRLDPLVPWSMRRARRLDVRVDAESGCIVADTMFRDVVVEADGSESAIHEYDVTVTVDAHSSAIVSVGALPRAVPGPECPGAVPSAQRIVGVTLDSIRRLVRDEMTGTTTCTHLNDALRAVSDVGTLAAILEDRGARR